MTARAWLTVLAALPCVATAQTSVSVAWLSDYQLRGVSLDGGHPTAQLALDHDTRSGLYGGATAARARLPYTNAAALATAYAGYAQHAVQDLTWEMGAARTVFRGAREYDYNEVYVGLARPDLNARLYWSPHYFGVTGASWYGEVNATWALARALDLQVHAGALRARGGAESWYGHGSAREDARIGVAWSDGGRSAWVAWSTTRGDRALYGRADAVARQLVAGVRYSF